MTNPPICPTCGHPVLHREIVIDRALGVISRHGVEARLTRNELAFFEEFLKGYPSAVHKDRVYDAIYASRIADKDFPEPKIVDVIVCKLRRKLAPLGMGFRTAWGFGYALTIDEAGQEAIEAEKDRARGAGIVFLWNEERESVLRDLVARGVGFTEIAARLKAPYKAITRHIDKLGLAA